MKKLTFKAIKEQAERMEAEEAFRWLLEISENYGEQVKKLADKYYKLKKCERKMNGHGYLSHGT